MTRLWRLFIALSLCLLALPVQAQVRTDSDGYSADVSAGLRPGFVINPAHTRYRVGAVWGPGQQVNIVNRPGSRYNGVVYLLNNPADFRSFNPYTGEVEEGYPVAKLPPTCESTGGVMPCWKTVQLPPDPPQDECVGKPKPIPGWTGSVGACVVAYDRLAWPADASFQFANTHIGLGYGSIWKTNDFYFAPPGAPFHPMYRHLEPALWKYNDSTWNGMPVNVTPDPNLGGAYIKWLLNAPPNHNNPVIPVPITCPVSPRAPADAYATGQRQCGFAVPWWMQMQQWGR